MIFELRLFAGKAIGHKPDKVIIFTWWTCQANPIDFSDRRAVYAGNFQSMELLRRHFYGRESTRDYGYGRGYEPIIVGAV